MKKLIDFNIRHLFVREVQSPKESGEIVGMISVKDVLKCSVAKHEAVVNKLYSLRLTELDDDPQDETAASALARSCYPRIDWKISENDSVYNAILRMSANNIGALAVVGGTYNEEIIGIITERDYLNKVGLVSPL